MKNFFTSLLGALAALVIFSAGSLFCLFMLFMMLAFAAGSGAKHQTHVEKGSYVVFDMSINVTDAPQQFDSGAVLGALAGRDGGPQRMQLRQITRALEAAAKDSRVAGVMLHGQFQPDGYGTGFAALKEIRASLEQVRAAKKTVVAFLDGATVREMFVASVADEVVLDPYGLLLMPGLSAEPVFLAGALEKFGVGVQVTRVGKYKSAIEPFTRTDMSPENREQMQKLLDDLWGGLRADIARGRGMDAEALQTLVDTEGIIRPEIALKKKLITRIAYRDEVIADLKTRTGREGRGEYFKQIDLAEYARMLPSGSGPARGAKKKGAAGRKGTVAVVYAEGAIVDGEGSPDNVGGERFARMLRRLRDNDEVSAIVLRVNSPGGSATASEHILREVRLAKKDKPVIVSMGAYAASGGYWIATYGDRIFAEAGTITGSIGVFGVQFDVQKLANNLGVTFDSVKTGKFAGAMTIARPKTAEEMAVYQRIIDWIYDEFVGRVADARDLTTERVHEIAQGRVWSGAEAQKLGLVDEIGGLDAAIVFAAEKAGLGSRYQVREYPRKKEFAEILAEAFGDMAPEQSQSRTGLLGGAGETGVLKELLTRFRAEAKKLGEFNDPKGVYARLPLELMVK